MYGPRDIIRKAVLFIFFTETLVSLSTSSWKPKAETEVFWFIKTLWLCTRGWGACGIWPGLSMRVYSCQLHLCLTRGSAWFFVFFLLRKKANEADLPLPTCYRRVRNEYPDRISCLQVHNDTKMFLVTPNLVCVKQRQGTQCSRWLPGHQLFCSFLRMSEEARAVVWQCAAVT